MIAFLLTLHQGLFRAGVLIPLVIAGWGLITWVRKQPASGGYRSTLVLTEALFVLQAVVGVPTAWLTAAGTMSAGTVVGVPVSEPTPPGEAEVHSNHL